MDSLLEKNPLLLLFLVAAIGYLVGTIKVRGASLGTAAVLFVGLLFGTFNPNYRVPTIVLEIGLIFFVYSMGLSSGTAFFQSFKKNGFNDFGFILVMLTLSALFAVGIHYLFGFDAATTVGIYNGSTTNTTALAGVTELINRRGGNADLQIEALVTGYAYSYPMGVFGVMVVLKYCIKWFKIDFELEKELLRKNNYLNDEDIIGEAIKITNAEVVGMQVRDFISSLDFPVSFGRILHNGKVGIAHWDTVLEMDDVIMFIAGRRDMPSIIERLGEEADENLIDNYKDYEVKRIFVSNMDVVGKNIASLNLSEKFDAVITRIRRGDVDMIAQSDTVLEVGDRIRFVARKKDLDGLSKFFGDSYYESSRVNLFSFGLGIALGLILGSIAWKLPGGISFKLGFAGGPLIVGLIFGYLRRTGPIVWALPYSANVTLRQLGLIFLLAVIGLQSGNSFLASLGHIGGLNIFLAGILQSMVTALISMVIGYKFFKIPVSMLLGFMSNQPAILDYVSGITKNRVPQLGYAIMFPVSLIMKILYAQLLYIFLSQ
jgi:putative transport protein